jgi:activator of 2-hydroxyglutaryl-CoA dehydratase/predicted nucleotide-binding protein (sugar kinase/HSP70/actin superfamily)
MAHAAQLLVGLDVGSTTVKAVAVDARTDEIRWSDYQRHETKQPEKTLEFLSRMEADLGIGPDNCRMFITGSGGATIAPLIGAKFVQEVTAVSLAVEKMHPEVNSVIELGGQDAKIIVFKTDAETGRKKKIPSMNDKCAGGTGAVIDKINAKLKIPTVELGEQGYTGLKLHKVAGKCGVFAETDINGLQKEGTPPDELMASLFEAIVLQNLTVLTRGHTLRPHVLLLGGPNTFIRGMREAWQANIPRMWQERGVEIPAGETPQSLIKTPSNAQYFAALGAVEFGKDEEDEVGRYRGAAELDRYITVGRLEEKAASGAKGLCQSTGELASFKEQYRPKPFVAPPIRRGERVRGFIGLDGGSTSTKAVLIDDAGDVVRKVYQLSKGNPIQDTIDMFASLRQQVEDEGATLEVLGVGTTGYAKDILRDVLQADAALVETVAHTESAIKFYRDPHVIVDVGGQDIKLIVLTDGRVKDFRLNTQCSAGNGYFLQSTAETFGIPLKEYADRAFSAQAMPVFGYGCAVFMQSDIVNFQRQGWAPEEILAGLAAVLPKNIFLYVASIPNLAKLGSRFVLQGGTQHNLAAVKAEVDFIRSSFRGADVEPEIIVHEHCGESGAIGAAVEALRLWKNGRQTTFIGLEAVEKISYRTTRNESTRCNFCKNNCLRTFVDVKLPEVALAKLRAASPAAAAKAPAPAAARLNGAAAAPAGVNGTAAKPAAGVNGMATTMPEALPAHVNGKTPATPAATASDEAPAAPARVNGAATAAVAPAKAAMRVNGAPAPPAAAEPSGQSNGTAVPAAAAGGAEAPAAPKPAPKKPAFVSKVPKADDEQRLILATCEKGSVEDVDSMRSIKAGLDSKKKANPNFVDAAAREVWKSRNPAKVADAMPARAWTRTTKERVARMQGRTAVRIGMPRVLNMYTYAPFFSGYFESLGVEPEHLVYSDFTTNELYREGAGRGAIDPCFPAKIGIAHVHNLLYVKHAKKKLDYIFFPMVDTMHTELTHLQGSNACPTVTVTPETAKAAFVKEGDVFAEQGLSYLCPILAFHDLPLLKKQLFDAWSGALGLSEEENGRAVDVGMRELLAFEAGIRQQAREVIDQLEREQRVGIVLLARPYHHDPGLNHEILEEFQKLGYPVFSQSTLPLDDDMLERLFGDEVRGGVIPGPKAITDAWKNCYSANTNLKVWAAKFTARHPNLVALEMSSFKCGHDAPIYSVIESIIEKSGTPYFSFKDVDENKPTGSIRIRVETIHYFLQRYVEDLRKRGQGMDIEAELAATERRLREAFGRELQLRDLAERQRATPVRGRILPVVAAGGGQETSSSAICDR